MKSPFNSLVTRSLMYSVMILALNACNSHGVKKVTGGANQSIGDGSQKDLILSERAGAYSNSDLSLSMGKNGLLQIAHLSGPSAAYLFGELGIVAEESDAITVGKVIYNVKAKVGAGTECRELSPQDTASKKEKIYDCRIGYSPKTGIVGRISPPYAGEKVITDVKEVKKDSSFKGSLKGALTANLVITKGEKKALIVINEASAVFSKMDGVASVPLTKPKHTDGKSERKTAPHVMIRQDAMKDSLEPVTTAGILISLEDGSAILNEGTKAGDSTVEDIEEGVPASEEEPKNPVVQVIFEKLEVSPVDKKTLKLSYQVTGADGKSSIGARVEVAGEISEGAQVCMMDQALDLDPTKTSLVLTVNNEATPTEINVYGIDAGINCLYESKLTDIKIVWDACQPAPQVL